MSRGEAGGARPSREPRGSLGYQLAFQFREYGERTKFDTTVFEVIERDYQVAQAAAQAVEFPNNAYCRVEVSSKIGEGQRRLRMAPNRPSSLNTFSQPALLSASSCNAGF
jgi:hypothetical protein